MQNGDHIEKETKSLMEGVIGALLLDKSVSVLIPTINIGIFQECYPYHQIFLAMKQALEEGKEIDLMIVARYLRTMKLDVSPLDLTQMTQRVASAAHVVSHISVLEQELGESNMALVLQQCVSLKVSGATAPEVIAYFQRNTVNIMAGSVKNSIRTMKESMAKFASPSESGKIFDFPLESLNEGVFMMEGDQVIVGGRPGSGKTAFGIQIARHQAKKGIKTAVISLEMTGDQVAMREVSNHSGMTTKEIIVRKEKKLGLDQIINGITEDYINNLYIVDQISDDEELYQIILVLILQYGVTFFVIDYIQLVNPLKPSAQRNSDIERLSRKLKSIAKEHKVMMMPLSQLSRDSEKGTIARKPKLSDLRDSGAIEQDATIVILLYRPESQGDTHSQDGQSLVGKAKIIVAKNRNGGNNIEKEVDYNGRKYEFTDTQLSLLLNDKIENPFD